MARGPGQRTADENYPAGADPRWRPFGGPSARSLVPLHTGDVLLHGPGGTSHVVRDFFGGCPSSPPELRGARGVDLRFYGECARPILHGSPKNHAQRAAAAWRGPRPAYLVSPRPSTCPPGTGGTGPRMGPASPSSLPQPTRPSSARRPAPAADPSAHPPPRSSDPPSRPPRPLPARSRRKSGRKPLYTIKKTANVYQRLLPLPPKGAKVGGPTSRLPPTFFERGGPAEGQSARTARPLGPGSRTLTYRGANVRVWLAVVGPQMGQRPRAAAVVGLQIGRLHRLRGLRRARQLGFSY